MCQTRWPAKLSFTPLYDYKLVSQPVLEVVLHIVARLFSPFISFQTLRLCCCSFWFILKYPIFNTQPTLSESRELLIFTVQISRVDRICDQFCYYFFLSYHTRKCKCLFSWTHWNTRKNAKCVKDRETMTSVYVVVFMRFCFCSFRKIESHERKGRQRFLKSLEDKLGFSLDLRSNFVLTNRAMHRQIVLFDSGFRLIWPGIHPFCVIVECGTMSKPHSLILYFKPLKLEVLAYSPSLYT